MSKQGVLISIKESQLSHDFLQQRLNYDPITGVFTWIKTGKRAGNIGLRGYRDIRINSILYKASRLAWFYIHGEWPTAHIDHINGVRDDDKFINLRILTPAENSRNCTSARNNPSHGVYRKGNKFIVQFWVDSKMKHFGTYPTEQAAQIAAKDIKANLGLHDHIEARI